MIWALVGFLAIQLGLDVLVDGVHPEINDDEFQVRLAALQARIAEAPDRPLLLMTGSSRCQMGYLPERVPPLRTDSGEQPLLYNFSHLGSGPIFNLLTVKRLLRRGIRPRWLVLEIMPPCLNHEYYSIATTCAEPGDFPTMCRYFPPIRMAGLFLRPRLFPCYRHRMFLCGTYLSPLAIKTVAEGLADIALAPLGGDAGWWLHDELDEKTLAHCLATTRDSYRPRLQKFQVRRKADRAIRETLRLCRENGIEVVLLLTPEGREFQSWYASGALPRIDAYCRDLARENAVTLVDARHWLPDRVFTDSHHPLRRGAEIFTELLARDVLKPMVEGSPSRKRHRETP